MEVTGRSYKFIGVIAAAFTVIALSVQSASGTLVTSTLVSFDGLVPGCPGGLIQADDGYLYGMVYRWLLDQGGVFRMTLDGNWTNVATFYGTNGVGNYAGHLVETPDGNFYGTTGTGGIGYTGSPSSGFGTIFRMAPDGTLTTLVLFNGTNGALPWASLLQGQDGFFYGVTSCGGPYSNTNSQGTVGFGTLFRVDTNGALQTLYYFDATNGAVPMGDLLQTDDGTLYGTTEEGGTSNLGTVFRATTDGTVTNLFSFGGTNGSQPIAGLIMASDGLLYGSTKSGGSANMGSVFRVTTNGNLTSLASFHGADGRNPVASLLQAADGNLYGTTSAGGTAPDPFALYDDRGTIFCIGTNAPLQTLVSFTVPSGWNPQTALIQANDGNIYGTTCSDFKIFRLAPVVVPQFVSIVSTNSGILLTWNSSVGQHYLLQFALDLGQGNWTAPQLMWSGSLGMNTATNDTTSYFDNWYSTWPQGFYRLRVIP